MKSVFKLIFVLFVTLSYQDVYSQTIKLTELTEMDLGVKIPDGMDAMSFGDFDNDGDLDLLVSGEYEMGMPKGKYLTKVFQNNNGKFIEYPTNLIGVRSSCVNWIDIDQDGDLDIFVYGLSGYDDDNQPIDVSKIYINNKGVFTEKELLIPKVSGIGMSSGGGIVWGDYDNDGDIDFVLSGLYNPNTSNYLTKVFENKNGIFIEKANLTTIGYGATTVSWFDFDKDGDLDILVTGNTTTGGAKGISTKMFINNNGVFSDANFDLPGIEGAVSFSDFNNDGYFDILLTGNSYYQKVLQKISCVYYNKNLNYQFSDSLNYNLTQGIASKIVSADFNNDGQLDILMTGSFGYISAYNPTNYIPKLYVSKEYDSLNFNFPVVNNFTVADYDHDGDLDVIMFGKKGSYLDPSYITKFYRNDISIPNTPPLCPNSYKTIMQGDSVILCWSKADDGGVNSTKTNSNSLTYNIYLKYNDSLVVSPNSNIENGFRKIVDYGNAQLDTFKIIKKLSSGPYQWGVQAIDNSFTGSVFSPVQSFTYCTQFRIDAGKDKNVICGSQVQFDSTIIINSGIGKLTYDWQPKQGLNEYDIQNPIAYVNKDNVYYLTVNSTNGCEAKDSVKVIVNPLEAYADDVNVSCGNTGQLDVTSNYSGSGALSYAWLPADNLSATNISNPVVSIIKPATYTVDVTTPNGCKASKSIQVNTSVIDIQPTICMVTVDSLNRNVVIWEKPNQVNKGIVSYSIYKESSTAGVYNKIGNVPYNKFSVFIDTNSIPMMHSDRYKISLTDVCGFESALSTYHRTLHLSVSPNGNGIGNGYQLNWQDNYEGFIFYTYDIFRSINKSGFIKIDQIQNTLTSYTDTTSSTLPVYYAVAAVKPNEACWPSGNTKGIFPVDFKGSNYSVSNINNYDFEGVIEITFSDKIKIYPNPTNDMFLIQTESQNNSYSLEILNILGEVVYKNIFTTNIEQVDLSSQPTGVYFIKLQSENNMMVKKIIKQ